MDVPEPWCRCRRCPCCGSVAAPVPPVLAPLVPLVPSRPVPQRRCRTCRAGVPQGRGAGAGAGRGCPSWSTACCSWRCRSASRTTRRRSCVAVRGGRRSRRSRARSGPAGSSAGRHASRRFRRSRQAAGGEEHEGDGRDPTAHDARALVARRHGQRRHAPAARRAVVEVLLRQLVAPVAEAEVLDRPRQPRRAGSERDDLADDLEGLAGITVAVDLAGLGLEEDLAPRGGVRMR